MSRPLRIEESDTHYHVLNRGNERRMIFRDDIDYHHFLVLLGQCSRRFDLEVWSYVLMGNHYHLLLKSRQANLSRAIQWLGVSYSSWFNRRHRRSGHLFQGRFKSFMIYGQDYLIRLILYIHRNPLRAKLTEKLRDYRWSSYRPLGYMQGCPEWFEREYVLGQFAGQAGQFRKAVMDYCEAADDLWENLYYGIVLGSEKILASVRRKCLRQEKDSSERPQHRQIIRHGSLEDLVEQYRKLLKIKPAELESYRRPIRHQSRPQRDVLIYLLWQSGCFNLAEIGTYFNVSYPAISRTRQRVDLKMHKDKEIKRLLTLISNK